MFKNYLKIAFRNLIKHKSYSLINIVGLAIGFTAFLLIASFVLFELSYDRFYPDYQDIYRARLTINLGGTETKAVMSMSPLSNALKQEYAGVKASTKIRPEENVLITQGEKKHYENNFLLVDSTFFEVFECTFIQGNPKMALMEPSNIVITRSIAEKYFGKTDVLGQILNIYNEKQHKITGVIEDLPACTHLPFTILVPIRAFYPKNQDQWMDNINLYNYVRLKPGKTESDLNQWFSELVKKYCSKELETASASLAITAQPIKDIHLYSNYLAEYRPNGSLSYVRMFSLVALFILIIACINFMNLTTARFSNRARETGLRKTFGAVRSMLVWQFLGEAFLLCLISMVLAIFLAEMFVPVFNQLFDIQLNLHPFANFDFLLLLVGITIITGILAGSYPAFFLSSFQPVHVLKGNLSIKSGKSKLRSVLVIVQFLIATGLIISTLVVYTQLEFVQSKNLGFNRDQVVVVNINNEKLYAESEKIKTAFSNIPGIEQMTATSSYMAELMDHNGYLLEPKGKMILISSFWCDYNLLQTMQIQLMAGRFFENGNPGDSANIIINEAAVRKFGWDEPLGRKLYAGDNVALTVIGVIDDFHISSLHNELEPIVIRQDRDYRSRIMVKLSKGSIQNALASMEKRWQELDPDGTFDFFFLDEKINEFYKSDKRLGNIFIFFTFLSILIACLGLYGLASFLTQQRTKEIGIRKILGASAETIIRMLLWEFSLWVIIAAILALPITFYLMDQWLNTFAYRIDFPWWSFGIAVLLTIVISTITILYQALKSAHSNPAEALKYE